MTTFRLFHRTEAEFATGILKEGFREDINNGAKSLFPTMQAHRGVYLSDIPVNCQDGAKGDVLLEVLFDMSEIEMSHRFEFIPEPVDQDDGTTPVPMFAPYREFLVPAAFVNAHSKIRLVAEDDADELDIWAGEVREKRWADYHQKYPGETT